MKRLSLIAGLLSLCFGLGWLVGCGYAKHVDPPLYTYDTDLLTRQSAVLHARDIGGTVTLPVANTHSMEPLIYGGDILVLAPVSAAPFGARLNGRVIAGHPNWNPTLLEVHRVQLVDKDGALVEGDNVDGQHPESHSRVTEANYIGEVVGIYRIKATL